jgi:hypothetical protein
MPLEWTMRILNLTEVFRMTEAGINLSSESESNDDRAAAQWTNFMR